MVRFKVKWFWHINAFPLHLSSRNFKQRLPMSWGYALLVSGSKSQRSRSQCIDYWKWLILHNAFPLHLSSWNFIQRLLMSRGFIYFWVKRSRSQCIENWKWLMSHNCFPFTPAIIMKLHRKTPHEPRMCPMDFGVKRSKVKVKNALITENG